MTKTALSAKVLGAEKTLFYLDRRIQPWRAANNVEIVESNRLTTSRSKF